MRVITISTDSPEDIAAERHLHGLQARMLSDVQLQVTDAFGLRNTGFHSAPPTHESVALPVPATLLVDREGRVLWIAFAVATASQPTKALVTQPRSFFCLDAFLHDV